MNMYFNSKHNSIIIYLEFTQSSMNIYFNSKQK
jgi:hypothetical protein